MKFSTLAANLACVALISACAESASKVDAAYVSQSIYAGKSCKALTAERNVIATRVNSLAKLQDQAATIDAVVTGIALVVFWPAAIALAATDDQAAELSVAKGNYDAITAQMTAQGCALPAAPVPAAPAAKPEPVPAECPKDTFKDGCPSPFS